jgi:hypothetical protein
VVSKPATTVAKAASYFENIPIIGPFAKATSIGARAIAGIASIFGFSNVPVIDETKPMRNEVAPQFASCEISYPVQKLTLDPKNELSIDPRITGINSGLDEMDINHLVTRDSYLCMLTWTTAQTLDQILFWSRVGPNLYDCTNVANNQRLLYMTPMSYIANLFAQWRGDIIFTFKVIASKYHKGRLRISYDPTGDSTRNIYNTPDNVNIVQTAIIDIGESSEVSFRIPYQQGRQFLNTRSNTYSLANRGWDNAGTNPVTYPYDGAFDNGVISVRVLNVLTSPAASSTVNIRVHVRAADNLELANPANVSTDQYFSPYQAQSEILSGDTKGAPDDQYLVHFGENVRSLRQLLRRYNYVSTDYYAVSNSSSKLFTFTRTFFKMPLLPGYTNQGINTALKLSDGTPASYNFVEYTHLAYLAELFLIYRGSTNWSFIPVIGQGEIDELSVVKQNEFVNLAGYGSNDIAYNSNVIPREMSILRSSGMPGIAVTSTRTNSGLHVQCPMFTPNKFQYCNRQAGIRGSESDGSAYDRFLMRGMVSVDVGSPVVTRNIVINNYVAIGTDFSFHFFLNCPTISIYTAVPGAG